MYRFPKAAIAGALITLSGFISACTTPASVDQTSSRRLSSSYQYDSSFNPACAGGFRPSNNRSCDY